MKIYHVRVRAFANQLTFPVRGDVVDQKSAVALIRRRKGPDGSGIDLQSTVSVLVSGQSCSTSLKIPGHRRDDQGDQFVALRGKGNGSIKQVSLAELFHLTGIVKKISDYGGEKEISLDRLSRLSAALDSQGRYSLFSAMPEKEVSSLLWLDSFNPFLSDVGGFLNSRDSGVLRLRN